MKPWIYVSLIKRYFCSKENAEKMRKATLLMGSLHMKAFKKMSLPDKITTLARLISIFEKDFQFVPPLLARKLNDLNRKLNQEVINGLHR